MIKTKGILYYILIVFVIIIILPFLIVRGCNFKPNNNNIINKDNGLLIKVYIASKDEVVEIELDEYVKGVVAAEMPAEFGLEALKAQAIAARTYVFGRYKKIYVPNEDTHKGADICTDPGHCQAWQSKEDALKKWSLFSRYKYWNKIERAVNETKNLILTYDGTVVNPLFHASSGGKTENSEDVWAGVAVPYLRSVVSEGEEASSTYESTVLIKVSDFKKKLSEKYPDFEIDKDVFKDIEVLDNTEGGSIKDLRIGNLNLKGTEVRTLFSLRSAKFKIEKYNKDTLKVTTLGFGHGVGMSQWGANYLSKEGEDFESILKHYYQGVKIESINQYMN